MKGRLSPPLVGSYYPDVPGFRAKTHKMYL